MKIGRCATVSSIRAHNALLIHHSAILHTHAHHERKIERTFRTVAVEIVREAVEKVEVGTYLT